MKNCFCSLGGLSTVWSLAKKLFSSGSSTLHRTLIGEAWATCSWLKQSVWLGGSAPIGQACPISGLLVKHGVWGGEDDSLSWTTWIEKRGKGDPTKENVVWPPKRGGAGRKCLSGQSFKYPLWKRYISPHFVALDCYLFHLSLSAVTHAPVSLPLSQFLPTF